MSEQLVKFGSTDCGDPCCDMSWVDKLDSVVGATIISKRGNDAFRSVLVENKDKVIFHATITGLGRTKLEPGGFDWRSQLEMLEMLIRRGFPAKQVVLRVDPIVGVKLFDQLEVSTEFSMNTIDFEHLTGLKKYAKLVARIVTAAYHLGVRRVRFSYLDLYPHVKQRFINAGLDPTGAAPSFEEMDAWNKVFAKLGSHLGMSIETCAETNVPEIFRVGCISAKDFELLGLDPKLCVGKCQQRLACLCCGNKVELLTSRRPCANKCLYCFWKDPEAKAQEISYQQQLLGV